MRILLLGCPGAGKGTQAVNIARQYQIPLIATGDMLRAAVAAGTLLGLKAKFFMDKGDLVPDEVTIGIVKERIAQQDCTNGFLLDGFPRTIPQAQALHDAGVNIDYIVEITVPDNEIIARLSGRWLHPASGRVYHEIYNPPRVAQRDDITGAPLIQRADDNVATVKERLRVYHEKTAPVVAYYESLTRENVTKGAQQQTRYIKINGVGTVEEVQSRILQKLAT